MKIFLNIKFIAVFSVVFLFGCSHNFTDKGNSEKDEIKKKYLCTHVYYSVDYSVNENLVVVDLCGCSNELNLDSIPKHLDLIKQIGEKAYNECTKKNAFNGVLIKIAVDSTNSKMRYYKYKFDKNKSLVLEEDSGIRENTKAKN